MEPTTKNNDFATQVERLHRLTVYFRWLFVAFLWLTVAPLALWSLRSDLALWQQYFTWTAVRYALYFNPLAAVGLSFCIGMTLAVLIWQSRNILWGLPADEKKRLENQVIRIRNQGQSHPLWKWVIGF